MSPETAEEKFDALLEYLKRTRGFDYTGYKRVGLMRRFQKQMHLVGVTDYADYIDYLEVHPAEFAALFNALLINVTTFFRDPEAWAFLARELLPPLLASKQEMEPLRVWCAGCASGEEAYTLAMLLAEELGVEQFRAGVKIYATDIDEEALAYARHASYGAREVAGIPESLLTKYFEPSDARYLFTRDLRRNVIFGRNDLMQDAPISRVDLLTCRNTLMYLNAEAQAQILSRFHFALNNSGILVLGKAEMLFSHGSLFQPRSLKWRLFSRVPRNPARERTPHPTPLFLGERDREVIIRQPMGMQERVFHGGPMAQVVVDAYGQAALINEQARSLFSLKPTDAGRPFQDLELSYQPADLRSLIELAQTQLCPATLPEVTWIAGGEARVLEVQAVPVLDERKVLLGVSLNFTDITRTKQLQAELEATNHELESAYEELQSANEELETTNEELQSINEELETTNEELQASNEELETTNEELQSTNEELHTINDEMRRRSAELDRLNSFLNSVLTALPGGVAVINTDLLVQIWSQNMEDLWGMRADEAIGRNFLNLDIGLPMPLVREALRDCLRGEFANRPLFVDAVNRRGRSIRCRFVCSPLGEVDGAVQEILLVMEEMEDSSRESTLADAARDGDGQAQRV